MGDAEAPADDVTHGSSASVVMVFVLAVAGAAVRCSVNESFQYSAMRPSCYIFILLFIFECNCRKDYDD